MVCQPRSPSFFLSKKPPRPASCLKKLLIVRDLFPGILRSMRSSSPQRFRAVVSAGASGVSFAAVRK